MDKLTFYFDVNFGKRLPGALSKLRPPMNVRWHLGEGFKQDLPDDVWLGVVGSKQWIVITQDQKFHKIASEAEAVRQHNVRCFYFPTANDGLWTSLCTFTKNYRQMVSVCERESAPFIYNVRPNGSFKRIL